MPSTQTTNYRQTQMPAALHARLVAEADRLGVPYARVLRIAVLAFLDKLRPLSPEELRQKIQAIPSRGVR